jgi:hypothetical protein
MIGNSEEIPTFLLNSDRTKSDRTRTKFPQNLPFHVNLAGEIFHSESNRTPRNPIGKLGLLLDSSRNRWGSVKTSLSATWIIDSTSAWHG